MHNVMPGGQQVFKERSAFSIPNRKAKGQVRPKNVKKGQKSLWSAVSCRKIQINGPDRWFLLKICRQILFHWASTT